MTTLASDQAITVTSGQSLTFTYSNNGILYIGHFLFQGVGGTPTLKAGAKYIIYPYNAADKMVLKLADKDNNILYSFSWLMLTLDAAAVIPLISTLEAGGILNTKRIKLE